MRQTGKDKQNSLVSYTNKILQLQQFSLFFFVAVSLSCTPKLMVV
jgi:hypothetical protein